MLLTGLPGISVPATALGHPAPDRLRPVRAAQPPRGDRVRRRSAQHAAPRLEFGLARLPFLGAEPASATGRGRRPASSRPRPRCRRARAEREQILLALAEAGGAVVKVRAQADEQQTHHEAWPYPELLADLVAPAGRAATPYGASAARWPRRWPRPAGWSPSPRRPPWRPWPPDVPVLIISDFGVSAEMINMVFAGSGCLGTLTDLRAAAGCAGPDPAWLEANYFHPASRRRLADPARAAARASGPPAGCPDRSGPARVSGRPAAALGPAAAGRLRRAGPACALGDWPASAADRSSLAATTRSHSSRTAPWPPGLG